MAEGRKENVVMFPFMGQGHLIPFLALAFQIQQTRGYTVTIVNTPLNIKKLRSSLPPNTNTTNTTTIRFIELPFCSADHGLPPDSENTDVLPYHLIIRLMEATLSLKPSFKRLISDITHQQHGYPPLCIIADMFFGWTIDIANEFGVFHAVFNTGSAYGMAIFNSLWLHLPHSKTNSDEFSLLDFPQVSRIHRSQLSNYLKIADGIDSWSIFLHRVLPQWLNSDGVLVNTVEDLDRTGLHYFRSKSGRPVWPIGPIVSSMTRARPSKEACLEWLDVHPPASVIYISFGSQNTVSASQMMELAMALEGSNKNFIWVVRPPLGFDVNLEFRAVEWLPEGFEDRMSKCKRGLLVRKWAPQLEILSHKSTGAFLSHCGWNSVLESLSHGVPIIAWPIAGEQFYNAKLLEEEMGVCVEVARGSGCEVRHVEIASVIEMVMDENGKGRDIRRKACEVKEMIKDAIRDDDEGYKGSSVKAMDEFFNAALSMRKTKEETK